MIIKMNYTNAALLLLFAFLLYSCSDDSLEIMDTEAPDIYVLIWPNYPWNTNDPGSDIVDGGNYTISIESGFQVNLKVRDESELESAEVYLLLNGNPEMRRDYLTDDDLFGGKKSYSIGYSIQANVFRLNNLDIFYPLQVGDTYEFYVKFADIHGNATEVSWTADLVE